MLPSLLLYLLFLSFLSICSAFLLIFSYFPSRILYLWFSFFTHFTHFGPFLFFSSPNPPIPAWTQIYHPKPLILAFYSQFAHHELTQQTSFSFFFHFPFFAHIFLYFFFDSVFYFILFFSFFSLCFSLFFFHFLLFHDAFCHPFCSLSLLFFGSFWTIWIISLSSFFLSLFLWPFVFPLHISSFSCCLFFIYSIFLFCLLNFLPFVIFRHLPQKLSELNLSRSHFVFISNLNDFIKLLWGRRSNKLNYSSLTMKINCEN